MTKYKAIDQNKSPKTVLSDLNEFICAQNNQNMFISAIYCSIDLKTLDLTIANAGHLTL